ncbi:hypothetical protein H4R99_004127 [Coemansia sp. RSA 1722]|nr:hypothetical protein IWW45_001477 [Coemansia sp. RSA 485]KAJ2598375.1 hypothetical protein H4R99_004127 [Coemansia sp. RSA 1722]
MHIFQVLRTAALVFPLASALGEAASPIVMWHGMGDNCCDNSTMGEISRIIQKEIPGVFIHSVKVGSSDSDDRKAGFFGNLNTQVDQVCKELSEMEELKDKAVNMLGFSQGGLFLRALVQRCPLISVKKLVTFGSPHSGVARIPECAKDSDRICRFMRQLALRNVYSWYVRDHVIQAQYFKDPDNIEQYLERNVFLPYVNNEIADRREMVYKDRLRELEKLVLIKFEQDEMIYPASSAWFGFVDSYGNETRLYDSLMYIEDWIGLRSLDESNRLDFVTLPGKHMNIGEEKLREIVARYFAADDDEDGFLKNVFSVSGPGQMRQHVFGKV